MNDQTVFFSLLETIETKKLQKITSNIHNMTMKKKQYNAQLKLLLEYKREYIQKIYTRMVSGVCTQQFNNYNDFILLLQLTIQENCSLLEKHTQSIEDTLKNWSNIHKKLKIWQILNNLNKKNLLKTKKIQEEILNNHYIQLKCLIKGLI